MLGIFDVERDADGVAVRLSRHGSHVLWALFWGLLIGAMAGGSLVHHLEAARCNEELEEPQEAP